MQPFNCLGRCKIVESEWDTCCILWSNTYEKIIPPLHLLTGAGWQLVWAGSNRNADCQSDNNSSSNSGHSNFNRSASVNINGNVNTNGYCEFRFIGSRE